MPAPTVILGVDPGTRLTGYGVLAVDPADRAALRPRLLDAGVVRLDPKAALEDRLVELERELSDVIREHAPAVVAVEELYSQYDHPRTAVVMGHARGVILLAARRSGARTLHLPANRVKQSLTGYGHAGKGQVQRTIQTVFGLAELPEPPDVADALAIALCAARTLAAE